MTSKRHTLLLLLLLATPLMAANAIGVRGKIGPQGKPKRVQRLQIRKSGVYENYLVDGKFAGGNRVKITANNVTVRHCEIRNCSGNGIGVFGKNVLIENCRIHHMLAGTFKKQRDAHGIAGRWNNVTIRNCEIYYVSGDCIQFDPDRRSSGKVVIDNCSLWTGPLPSDTVGFRKGQRPGENAFDSKTPKRGPRCQLVMRRCVLKGWRQPGQISLVAALNIKENVDAKVEQCLFIDNQVCFRLRGPTRRGAAKVTIKQCAIFDSRIGLRVEDKLRDLKVSKLGFNGKVRRKYHFVGRGPFPGYENKDETKVDSYEKLLKQG